MQNWFKQYGGITLVTAIAVYAFVSCKQEKATHQETQPIQFANPSSGYAGMSRMFATQDGIYMSWVEQQDSLATLKYAMYNGTDWTPAKTIASGTDWFVNWADFPAIAVNKGNIFAHYLQKSAPDTYAYDIKYKVYNKEQNAWSEASKLHTDTTSSEHGFVAVIPYGDGGFMASWLDGRNTVHVPDSLRQMTLRAGIINADSSLGQQWQLDDRVCDCCATSISNTAKGPVVVYRDRSVDEIRDIYAVQLIDTVWTQPKPVYNDNWHINGCPVNGPAIASGATSTAVTWFTNANNNPIVQLALSNNSGQNFNEAILLDSSPAIGRVAIQVDDKGNSYVLFMSENDQNSKLNLVMRDAQGKQLKAMALLDLPAERASGFPQLVLHNGNVVISYTDVKEKTSQVKTVMVPVEAFN